MKRIAIHWTGTADVAAKNVTIQIRSSELLSHLIGQKGLRDARSLSELQKLSMEHLRQWGKFPPRILRSL